MARRKKRPGWFGDTPGHRRAGKGLKVPWASRGRYPTKEDVREKHESRSPQAKEIDERIDAKDMYDMAEPEGRAEWFRNSNRVDIEGLDGGFENKSWWFWEKFKNIKLPEFTLQSEKALHESQMEAHYNERPTEKELEYEETWG